MLSLKSQFPLLYYDKAQSNMAHKAVLDVVPPPPPQRLASVLSAPSQSVSSTSGPLHMLDPLAGKLLHPLSLANFHPSDFNVKNCTTETPLPSYTSALWQTKTSLLVLSIIVTNSCVIVELLCFPLARKLPEGKNQACLVLT